MSVIYELMSNKIARASFSRSVPSGSQVLAVMNFSIHRESWPITLRLSLDLSKERLNELSTVRSDVTQTEIASCYHSPAENELFTSPWYSTIYDIIRTKLNYSRIKLRRERFRDTNIAPCREHLFPLRAETTQRRGLFKIMSEKNRVD